MIKKYIMPVLTLGLFPAIASASEGHAHGAGDSLQIEWGLKGASELTNIHPLFVHFPIALLLASLGFYLLGLLLKKEQPLIAGKWALVAGTIAAGFTVWTGLLAAGTVPHGGGTHSLMIMHQYFGYGILGLSILLSVWALISKANLPVKGRIVFLILIVLLGGAVIQGADLGGRMVFLHGVGVGNKSMMVDENVPHGHGDHQQNQQRQSEHDHGAHAH